MEKFHLYTGNNLDQLAATMLETLSVQPQRDIFSPERFIVQSKGMEFWLSQRIARHRGVCSNVLFEAPERFLQSVYRALNTTGQAESGWDRDTLTWIIMRVLPTLLTDGAFTIVKAYLHVDGAAGIDQQKLYQLAMRIADLFDQYMVFRAERVLEWHTAKKESDPDAEWQRILWKAVAADIKKTADTKRSPGAQPVEEQMLHRAGMQRKLLAQLGRALEHGVELPERVTVFGISYLPPFYMEVLGALAAKVDVHYFAVNPACEYWSDVSTPGERKARAAKIDDEYLGNGLLSSLAVQGRNFFRMLLDGSVDPQEVGFTEPVRDTLLHRIQNDIYHHREASTTGEARETVAADDRSVVVQNCHSPMREMEVLHDHLLSMFDAHPEIGPGDVIVMAPAIEDYVPYIEAVFNTADDGSIPYTIADRTVKGEHKITEAIMTLLRFPHTRFAASSVIELLEVESIAERFNLSVTELDAVKKWIDECRIRWGLDGTSVEEQYHLRIDTVNTWRYGLSRMLLGYAYPSGADARMFEGIRPFDNIEGGDAVTLGKLLAFFTRLEMLSAQLSQKRTLKDWAALLQELIDGFFRMSYEDKSALIPAVGELALLQARSGFAEAVDVAVVVDVLGSVFDSEGASQRFLRGGVSFCSLLPMRSIPATIICLVGMNNGAYPRQQQKLGFNLMAKEPKQGDRSRRNDDRYMFLEAIISAQQQLYISYCGQSVRENTPLPPSVTVNELLDYIEHNFTAPDKRCTAEHFAVRHKLQAFNPEYFSGARTHFSYSKKYEAAAVAVHQAQTAAHPFCAGTLGPPPHEELGVDVDDFIRFFRNPSEYFLKNRLQVSLRDDDEVIEDNETFSLDSLAKYSITQELVSASLQHEEPAGDEYERCAAAGVLPHGILGRKVFAELSADVGTFADGLRTEMAARRLADAVIDIPLGALRITGVITNVYADKLLLYRMAKMKPKDFLAAWISHLLLLAARLPGYPVKTVSCSFEKKLKMTTFTEEPDPMAVLGTLAALYLKGMRRPLPFFPESSKTYVDAIRNGAPEEEALGAAKKKYTASFAGPAEAANVAIAKCFEDADPFTGEFTACAKDIYMPMLDNCEARGEAGA